MNATRRATLSLLLLACLVSCASGPDTPDVEPAPTAGEDLTTGQQVLNVVTFPFRVVGYALYYPLKFVFYDIWAALFGWIFGAGDGSDAADVIDRLDDPDPQVRARAALALASSEEEAAAAAVVRLLEDRDEGVIAAAVQTLGRIGAGLAEAPAISQLQESPRPEVRAASARLLGLLEARVASFALLRALDDPVWSVRAEAAMALGRIGSWSAGPRIAEALRDDDPRVRGAAALALGRIGDRRAVPFLKPVFRRLEEEGTFVRAAVITALAELNAAEVAEDLLAIARGEGAVSDPHSRSAALWAAGAMNAAGTRALLEDVLLSGKEPLKVLEGAALGLGRLKAADALSRAAGAEEVSVRIASIVGLIELGDERALDILGGLVQDPYSDVRQRAIVSMLFLGYRDAVVFLIDQIHRADPEIRAWAYLELQRISGLDFGLDAPAWLQWWEEAREDWPLRRYYPEPER